MQESGRGAAEINTPQSSETAKKDHEESHIDQFTQRPTLIQQQLQVCATLWIMSGDASTSKRAFT